MQIINGCSASAEMSLRSRDSIPADVLRLILKQIHPIYRLKDCAVVSKAWCAAAAAATDTVHVFVCDDDNPAKTVSLWQWMKRHGRHSVNVLMVSGWTRDAGGDGYDYPFNEQLQLPQLQDLLLIGNDLFPATSKHGSFFDSRQQKNPLQA